MTQKINTNQDVIINHDVKVNVDVKLTFELNVNKNTDFDEIEERIKGGAAVAGLRTAQAQIEQVINKLLEEHDLENSKWSNENQWNN